MVAIHVLYEVVVTKVIITIVAEAVYRGYAVGYLPHRYRSLRLNSTDKNFLSVSGATA